MRLVSLERRPDRGTGSEAHERPGADTWWPRRCRDPGLPANRCGHRDVRVGRGRAASADAGTGWPLAAANGRASRAAGGRPPRWRQVRGPAAADLAQPGRAGAHHGPAGAANVRMSQHAFEDEGLYLYVGHLEIRALPARRGAAGRLPSYFSGAPVLYPVLGALADSIGGLAAARALSLLEMLAVTGLLYAMSRRLFNERVGLCAAVPSRWPSRPCSSATWPPTTPPRCSCSTLATWLVVRTAAFRWPAVPAGRAGRRARGRHQVRDTAVRAEHHRPRRAGCRAESWAAGP